MSDQRRLLEELQRQMLRAFVETMFRELEPGTAYVRNWHVDTICWHLEQVANGKCLRLMINLPPRSLKSFIGSVAFPAWFLGRDPARKVVTVSYSADLAAKLTGDFRRLIETPTYRRLFPAMKLKGKNTEIEQRTAAGGHRYATSVGGTLTGRGGDIIIVDDPIKADSVMSEAERTAVNTWFRNTVVSRLDNKTTGAIVIIMQRLHQDDLVGHLTEEDEHGWTVVNIPAIATEDCSYRISDHPGREYHYRKQGEVLDPGREPLAALNKTKRNIGSDRFSAQYQQMPLPPGGNLIQREWLVDYDELPDLEQADAVILSLDTAASAEEHNDFSVCTTWAVFGDHYYLFDVFRRRVEFPDLKKNALSLIAKYRPNIVMIENAGTGMSLRQVLINELREKRRRPRLFKPTPRGDKVTRVAGVTALLEQGRVHIPKDAPWRDEFLKEVLGFPSAKHDDQVDSMEQFLRFMQKLRFDLKFDPATGERIRQRRGRR
ncbi:MAG: phage terminase large subunit [Mesorhizobium sp.]|nr:phage terminase large subunit [Mesorhizobium sp.]MBL8575601.1 phage terminase large subunit [Mesorhizobium sp.]